MLIITLSEQQDISEDRSYKDLVKLRDVYGYSSVRFYPHDRNACEKCKRLYRKGLFDLNDFINLRGIFRGNDSFYRAPFFSWTHPQVNLRSFLVVSGEGLPDIYLNYREILNKSRLRNLDRNIEKTREFLEKPKSLVEKQKERREEREEDMGKDFY